MKRSWMLMLFWFVYQTGDLNQVTQVLDTLGKSANQAKVIATSNKGFPTYTVLYEAPSEINFNSNPTYVNPHTGWDFMPDPTPTQTGK